MATPDQSIVLGTAPGPVLELWPLGATVHRLEITGGDGVRRNVVLGHATAEERLGVRTYVGATVGRYANRIAGGRLEVDGVTHTLDAHDRGHLLHGGGEGFDRRVWEVVGSDGHTARLRLVSPDGDQGFPGRLVAEIEFAVTGTGVRMTITAQTDAPTVCNLTHHGYANLDGDGSGSIDAQRLTVPADLYTPVDDTDIPLGEHAPVAGTPFDLRDGPLLADVIDLDHNFVVRGSGMRTLALLDSPRTRTRLEIRSDQPGLQIYTGQAFDGSSRSTDGVPYAARAGIALEPQLFPDSPHHPEWPSAELRPGETYRHELEWRFSHLPG